MRTNQTTMAAMTAAHVIQAAKFGRSTIKFIATTETATIAATAMVRAQPCHVTGVAP
jgi:hypothetical protein